MSMQTFADLLEAITIFCFGLSWPISIRKSFISRTSQGKSLFFEVFVLIGYAFAIIRKIIQVISIGSGGFVFSLGLFFYILNFLEIIVDMVLYFRNVKYDKLRRLNSKA